MLSAQGMHRIRAQSPYVPTLTQPLWVTRSMALRQLQPEGLYSPDPQRLFSGVVVSCAGMSPHDQEMIAAAVESLGGAVKQTLCEEVTHLVTASRDTSKVRALEERPDIRIAVVAPHWVNDSFRLNRRLPLRDFVFDLSKPDALPTCMCASWDRPQDIPSSPSHSPDDAGGAVLAGKKVLFARDIHGGALESHPELHSLRDRVVGAGGTCLETLAEDATDAAVEQAVRDADLVVARFRESREFGAAMREDTTVGTLPWLVQILSKGRMSSPRDRLLHFPYPESPVPGFDRLTVTITNYSGAQRTYLKDLIAKMGGTFTPHMTPSHHVCIALDLSGEKVLKAREWNIPIVNHIWLEQCFATWTNQNLAQSQFITFPGAAQLKAVVGQASVPDVCLKPWLVTAEAAPEPERSQATPEPEEEPETNDTPTADTPANGRVTSAVDESVQGIVVNGQEKGKGKEPETERDVPIAEDEGEEGEQGEQGEEYPDVPEPNESEPEHVEPKHVEPEQVHEPEQAGLEQVQEMEHAEHVRDAEQAGDREDIEPEHVAPEHVAPEHVEPGQEPGPEHAHDTVEDATKEPVHPDASGGPTSPAVQDAKAPHPDADESAAASELSFAAPQPDAPPARPSSRPSSRPSLPSDEQLAEAELGVHTPARSKRKSDTSEHRATPTSARKRGKVEGVCLATTSVELKPSTLQVLDALQVTRVDDVSQATHLVAKGLTRTEKMLCAIALGTVEIVSVDWLKEVVKRKALVDAGRYALVDREKEAKWNMTLSNALATSRAAPGALLEGHTFYLGKGVQPSKDVLRHVIAAAGGQAASLSSASAKVLVGDPAHHHVIASREEAKQLGALREQCAKHNHVLPLWTPELILAGVLRQDMQWDEEYALHL